MSWIYTELLFPIITTAVGAVIGGISAYFIAKNNFVYGKEKEGDAYLSLVMRQMKNVDVRVRDEKKLLLFEDNYDASDFFALLFNKHKALEMELALFQKYWDQFSEEILLGGLKHICKKKKKRERNDKIANEIVAMCEIVTEYLTIAKKYRSDYEEEKKTNRLDPVAFRKSELSEQALSHTSKLLAELISIVEKITTEYEHT